MTTECVVIPGIFEMSESEKLVVALQRPVRRTHSLHDCTPVADTYDRSHERLQVATLSGSCAPRLLISLTLRADDQKRREEMADEFSLAFGLGGPAAVLKEVEVEDPLPRDVEGRSSAVNDLLLSPPTATLQHPAAVQKKKKTKTKKKDPVLEPTTTTTNFGTYKPPSLSAFFIFILFF
jgi:hypothetical protein